jgi:hypothetical protein
LSGITLEHAEAQLALWLDADQAVSSNQSYTQSIGGSSRTLTRADAAEIRNNIDYWDNWCRRLSRETGITAIGVITR